MSAKVPRLDLSALYVKWQDAPQELRALRECLSEREGILQNKTDSDDLPKTCTVTSDLATPPASSPRRWKLHWKGFAAGGALGMLLGHVMTLLVFGRLCRRQSTPEAVHLLR